MSSTSTFTTKATIASFGGTLYKLTHPSPTTTTPMSLNLYLPPAALSKTSGSPKKVPLLIYLSGLTCTPDNCAEKGFFQHAASRHSLAVLYPDTSPRGLDPALPGEHDAWDFGSGAGFYVDATTEPWKGAYRMETYVSEELPGLLFKDPVLGAYLDQAAGVAITGHSMGGHGALTLYLKKPGKYVSCSAFAPIANPTRCPWGKKAFSGYLGHDEEAWKDHDATELVGRWKGGKLNVLIDQGTADNFYKQGQLLPENFEKAVREAGLEDGCVVRYQEGYDHSYYFMASFADEHVEFAARHLGVLKE